MKKLSLSASRFIINVTVISVILLMGSYSIITPSAAAAGTDIKIFLNNTPLEFGVYENDPEPYIKEGRTLVPFRKIFEALNMEVSWIGTTQTVGAKNETINMELYIGKNHAFVNGYRKELDVPPEITDSRTFVPLRFVSESCGAEVIWEAETRSIYIKYAKGEYRYGEEVSYEGVTFSVDNAEKIVEENCIFLKGKTSSPDTPIVIELVDSSNTSYTREAQISTTITPETGKYEFTVKVFVRSAFKPKYIFVKSYTEKDRPYKIAQYTY